MFRIKMYKKQSIINYVISQIRLIRLESNDLRLNKYCEQRFEKKFKFAKNNIS